jgi:hypothetical protein
MVMVVTRAYAGSDSNITSIRYTSLPNFGNHLRRSHSPFLPVIRPPLNTQLVRLLRWQSSRQLWTLSVLLLIAVTVFLIPTLVSPIILGLSLRKPVFVPYTPLRKPDAASQSSKTPSDFAVINFTT